MNQQYLVIGAILIAQCFFGGWGVVAKIGMAYSNPIFFTWIRQITSAGLLIGLATAIENHLPDRRKWWVFALSSGAGMFGNQIIWMMGIYYAGANLGALMQPLTPVYTVILAVIFGYEKPTLFKLLGILLASVGAVIMIGFHSGAWQSKTTLGIFLFLINTGCMGFYYLWQKQAVLKNEPFPITAIALDYGIAAFLTCIVFIGLLIFKGDEYWVFGYGALGPLAYAVLGTTIVGYVLLAWAVQHTQASVIAVSSCLQVPITAVLSYIIWSQTLGLRHVLGGILILIGMLSITWDKYRTEKDLNIAKASVEEGQPILHVDAQTGETCAIRSPTTSYSSLLVNEVELKDDDHEELTRPRQSFELGEASPLPLRLKASMNKTQSYRVSN